MIKTYKVTLDNEPISPFSLANQLESHLISYHHLNSYRLKETVNAISLTTLLNWLNVYSSTLKRNNNNMGYPRATYSAADKNGERGLVIVIKSGYIKGCIDVLQKALDAVNFYSDVNKRGYMFDNESLMAYLKNSKTSIPKPFRYNTQGCHELASHIALRDNDVTLADSMLYFRGMISIFNQLIEILNEMPEELSEESAFSIRINMNDEAFESYS